MQTNREEMDMVAVLNELTNLFTVVQRMTPLEYGALSVLQLAGAKSRTYAPDGTCTRLSVLRIAGYGTAVLPSVAPPIRSWGYYFVSLFRLFPS